MDGSAAPESDPIEPEFVRAFARRFDLHFLDVIGRPAGSAIFWRWSERTPDGKTDGLSWTFTSSAV
jgi:hypothetical protein